MHVIHTRYAHMHVTHTYTLTHTYTHIHTHYTHTETNDTPSGSHSYRMERSSNSLGPSITEQNLEGSGVGDHPPSPTLAFPHSRSTSQVGGRSVQRHADTRTHTHTHTHTHIHTHTHANTHTHKDIQIVREFFSERV